MRNFKGLALLIVLAVFAGCYDSDQQFFDSALINNQSNQIEFQSIHQLNLTIEDMKNRVDESGFSPKLKSEFTLSDQTKGPWPHAWVAFNIELSVKGKKLAQITRASAMHNHSLTVNFEQTLPNFGVKAKDVAIEIKPIAWMPTFPLIIEETAHESGFESEEKVSSVN